MAPPKGTLWPRGDHTEGKHLVLEEYLKAWFPILGMGRGTSRILEFVQSDETIFHDGQVKKQLKSMEREGRITVDPTTRPRALSYPPGCRVSFLPANPTLL